MAIHAVALRAFNAGANPSTRIAIDQFLPNMSAGQFADWERAHLVRAATAAEIAAANLSTAPTPIAPPAPVPPAPEPERVAPAPDAKGGDA